MLWQSQYIVYQYKQMFFFVFFLSTLKGLYTSKTISPSVYPLNAENPKRFLFIPLSQCPESSAVYRGFSKDEGGGGLGGRII